jgi:hypothetical protein
MQCSFSLIRISITGIYHGHLLVLLAAQSLHPRYKWLLIIIILRLKLSIPGTVTSEMLSLG